MQDIEHEMKKTGNYNEDDYKTWYKNKADYPKKAKLMRGHFDEIVKTDAILVLNLSKKGIDGYIGGNVLMEMGLAFHLKKPIFMDNNF